MIGRRENACVPLADRVLVNGFKSAATAVISDNMSRMPGASKLRPFHRNGGGTMVGTALTVRTASGDNLFIHKALDLVGPGYVLIIDGGGDESRALIGEIMSLIASTRGAAGIVVDGAVRDAGALQQSDFPIFSRAANHRGPYKNGPGEINVAVSIGGLVVEPGDIVVGDEDGVVAFPQLGAAELLTAVRAQEKREAEIMQSIREGRYTGVYGNAAKSPS